MYRSPSPSRRFSLRGLCVAGALASLGLPLGRQACGIGGSAIQPTYTPRESVGAAPAVSLISSGSSSAAAASVAASGTNGAAETNEQGSTGGSHRTATRHVSSDDEGHGTVKKRRKRKTEEETGEGTRVAKGKGKGGGGTTAESKDYEDKEVKNALVAPPAKPLMTLSVGAESRYIYHGVDIVGFNSTISPSLLKLFGKEGIKFLNTFFAGQPTAPNATSPIVYTNGDIAYKGFHLGVGYTLATDETIPSRVQTANEAVTLNKFANYLDLEGFNIPTGQYNRAKRYYEEVDINLDYTLSIVANVLDATVGYNSYVIPAHDFKGTNYQGEALGRLTYKQIPYVQPSITYFRYISDARATTVGFNGINFAERQEGEYLNGNYVEARIDGAIPIYRNATFSVALAPYVLISLNDGYLDKEIDNKTHTEFNTIELGAKVPFNVGGHFAITPYVNYGYDISHFHESNDFNGGISPFKEDVWGGVTISYRF